MEKPLSIQLYTVRDHFAQDSLKTLKALKQIGYSAVEFGGSHPWKAPDLKAQLDEVGMWALGAHIPVPRLRDDLSGVIGEAKTLGYEYVVCPWLPPEGRGAEAYRALLPLLAEVGRVCRSEGLIFAYHNHDFELYPVFGPQNALEFFAERLEPGLMAFELDVYWAAYAGVEPVKFLEAFAGRAPLLHCKDMTRDDSRTFAEVGSGRLDFPAVLRSAEALGMRWAVVEQDTCKGDPLDSAASSFRYLRTQGLG
ncbi:MAG: sugar phosphate isomerase/epimerase [Meiothermus sp.]|nr:sugar phosphate isomerase/epimerase [Meiothermus sp.]